MVVIQLRLMTITLDRGAHIVNYTRIMDKFLYKSQHGGSVLGTVALQLYGQHLNGVCMFTWVSSHTKKTLIGNLDCEPHWGQ